MTAIPEALLIASCIYGKGCTETTQAYSNYNKTLIENLTMIENEYKKKYPTTMNYFVPYGAALWYGEGSVYLLRGFNLEIKDKGNFKGIKFTGEFK